MLKPLDVANSDILNTLSIFILQSAHTMLSVNSQRRLTAFTLVILLGSAISGCSKVQSSGFKAACHGDELTAATETLAIENGWQINGAYNCVDKTSYDKWAAALSPEEIKDVMSSFSDKQEKAKDDRAQELIDNEQYIAEALANMNTQPVEANTAEWFELGNIIGVGDEAGTQIMQAREKRLFTDWDDLLTRVPVFKVANTAHDASISGMTVNGKSLPGADQDPKASAALFEKQLRKFNH
jgi:hypothetical protein